MALHLLACVPCYNITRMPLVSSKKVGRSSHHHAPSQCMVGATATATTTSTPDDAIIRRTGNYQPTIWDNTFIQSLTSHYGEETCMSQANKLKGEVRKMVDQEVDPLCQLELIDNLQRLGLSYHFEPEITRILTSIYNNDKNWNYENDLYATSLKFRLLRQHDYDIPQGVFMEFLNKSTMNFNEYLSKDIKGLLSLYEASYLSVEGESILDKGRDFATKHLQEHVNDHNKDDQETTLITIQHALELPFHWRMPRVESRWFIDAYGKREDKNDTLLELAKLDFNMVQAIYQEELKHLSRWWSRRGLAKELPFSRDRLMENFLWTVGLTFEPQYGYERLIMTKCIALITTFDDVYDVYGSLDELKLFTDAVDRWDINAVDSLPDYMKLCFFSLYNDINEIAYDIMKKQGINIISYLRKGWAVQCKAFLLEAEWFYGGYKPSLQEYIENALVSVSGPLILLLSYFLATNSVSKDGITSVEKRENIIRWSSLILRLADDLGTTLTELQRGDNPKSIQCYMHDTGTSEEDAREHIRHLISETWKKMNKDRVTNLPFTGDFVRISMNLARMAQCMYHYGDGHASQDEESKDRILSLLVQPIIK